MIPPEILKAQARYRAFRENLPGEVGAAFINLCLAKTLVKTIADDSASKILMRALSHELLFLKVILDTKEVLTEDNFVAAVLATCREMKLSPGSAYLIVQSLYRFLEIENATDSPTQRNADGEAR